MRLAPGSQWGSPNPSFHLTFKEEMQSSLTGTVPGPWDSYLPSEVQSAKVRVHTAGL
jgi:hypothetical protein